jgi:predicted PurR-regulated permease PerM
MTKIEKLVQREKKKVKILSKSCQKVVKKMSKSCQKVVKKVKKLSKNLSNFFSKMFLNFFCQLFALLSGEKEEEEEDWWLLDQVATSSHLLKINTIKSFIIYLLGTTGRYVCVLYQDS